MVLSSPAFTHNHDIPVKYTCQGADVSPPLTIKDAPSNTLSFVLTVTDPDAPGKTWIHWVVYNIDPSITEIVEATVPDGGVEGINDFGSMEYGGPCPPSGKHRYVFTIYALDSMLEFDEGAGFEEIMDFVEKHSIGESSLIGLYQKS